MQRSAALRSASHPPRRLLHRCSSLPWLRQPAAQTVALALSVLLSAAPGASGALETRRLRRAQPEMFSAPGAATRDAAGQVFPTDGTGLGNTNHWQGQSSANLFRVLDDLEPVAPMDEVLPLASEAAEATPIASAGSDEFGRSQAAMAVPRLLRPSAFPAGEAQPLGGSAVLGFRRGGVVSPSDALPPAAYPLQAPQSVVGLVPVTAREDRIPHRFARYVEQVESRRSGCGGSEACTTPCRVGDQVALRVGNVEVYARVLSAHVGNRLKILFDPVRNNTASYKADLGKYGYRWWRWHLDFCHSRDACSIFRPCRQLSRQGPCVASQVTPSRQGERDHNSACPANTILCRNIMQLVQGSTIWKGSKSCTAAAPSLSASKAAGTMR